MPRAPRVEYEGACYHVMARGNRREPIVFDDDDRKLFVRTFSEAVERCGWEVFAWVLMNNHYHLIFRTPQPNLVEGMQWMQNAYTRRINARHHLWGHLFGGRYRSILIENQDYGGSVWRDYLRTAIDYVHLNPGRAGLVDGIESSTLDYPWISLAQGMAKPPSKRPSWLQVTEVLDLFGERDHAAGRRKLVQRYDDWITDENGTDPEVEGLSFATRLERGWYWGSEALQRLESEPQRASRNYQASETMRDFHEQQALQIIEQAEVHFGQPIELLKEVRRNDWTRAAIGWAIWKRTSVPHKWIAEAVNLKSAANSSQQIRRFAQVPDKDIALKLRKWRKSINVA